ncbi:limonene-1,2-epoxide hydrolase family protein [Nocardia brevicatena]|uniref:limonene-1,2-epoxide hydrolase family protein n=1 Tax=Nocardia brevicatena TaxID=37327 RepID=UPI0002DFCA36|nr:limonene-1,2-epoxide hydrolase family protein [Nocardia brevicatena]
MTTARNDKEQFVLDFFADMVPDPASFKRTYNRFPTEDAEGESVGFDHHPNLQDSLKYLDTPAEQTGMAYCDINVINIASAGDLVFTECVDTMRKADSTKIMDFHVAGVPEGRDGKIHRYTDSLGTATQPRSPAQEMGHTAAAGVTKPVRYSNRARRKSAGPGPRLRNDRPIGPGTTAGSLRTTVRPCFCHTASLAAIAGVRRTSRSK